MKQINQYLPTILIILLFFAGYVGYNRFVSNQAANRALFERTRNEMQEDRETYLKEIKELNKAILKQDSILIKYERQLKYLENQNNALYDKYNSLPAISLPDL